jgi:hypothetical protein
MTGVTFKSETLVESPRDASVEQNKRQNDDAKSLHLIGTKINIQATVAFSSGQFFRGYVNAPFMTTFALCTKKECQLLSCIELSLRLRRTRVGA